MRKCLGEEFNHIWHLDLGGDARSIEGGGSVFDITVSAGITILIRNQQSNESFIRYHRVSDTWRKKEKLDWLAEVADLYGVQWKGLKPDAKNAWLTEGLVENFESFVPIGSKIAKSSFSAGSKTIFKNYSLGVSTNRDEWVYDFHHKCLVKDVKKFIDFYNSEVKRWQLYPEKKVDIDNFVVYDDKSIKWSSTLKSAVKSGKRIIFAETKIRTAMYRPFCKQFLNYDEIAIDRQGVFQKFLPASQSNLLIVVPGEGNRQPFGCFMTNCVASLDFAFEKAQCFPLYTYSLDGSTRFDNITHYALDEARKLYGADVTREDIFYATYALLHHPAYRTKYAENLKRELPRLPMFALPGRGEACLALTEFREYSRIGRALSDLHVGYESAAPHPLEFQDTTPAGQKFSFRVEKMRFDKDKSTLRVNDCITLRGFVPEMFEYRLGNRSALDWVVESYRVKVDARSGLVSDPNRKDEPRFIIDLIGKVATVSLETQKLIGELPELV